MNRRPAVIPVGEGATDYIPRALALHKRGIRTAVASEDGAALFLLRDRDIKIVMLVSEYALFLGDPATLRFLRVFPDAVPATFPKFETLLAAHPTFYPIYPDEILTPLYDRFKVYVAGRDTAYLDAEYLTPILSSYGEYLEWQMAVMQPQPEERDLSGNNWLVLTYALSGYFNPNDLDIRGKLVLYKGSVLWEADLTAPFLHVVSLQAVSILLRPGIFCRRLKDTVQGDVVDRLVIYGHDAGTHSGTLYEISEVGETLALTPLPLPALPYGSRLWSGHGSAGGDSARRVDYTYDIFTSERAQHYYVIKTCIDSFVNRHAGITDPIYDPQGSDVALYAGMSLAVEKRKKSDWSVVTTYQLTPTAIDTVLQGFQTTVPGGAANVRVNANGCVNATGTINDTLNVITRFVAQSGFVLVDDAGTEYPIIAGVSLSQDHYNAGDSNLFCQAALLWLGGSGGYSWGGVDAAGLVVTESQPGLLNDQNIGDMRHFGRTPGIGDSRRLMLCLEGFYTTNTFQVIPVDNRTVKVKCAHLGHSRQFVDDRQGVTEGDKFYVDGILVYTIVSPMAGLAANVNAIMEGINANTSYVASNYVASTESGVPVGTFTLSLPGDAPSGIDVSLAYRSIWGYSNQRRVVSVRIEAGAPVVRLEKLVPQDQPLYMFDI